MSINGLCIQSFLFRVPLQILSSSITATRYLFARWSLFRFRTQNYMLKSFLISNIVEVLSHTPAILGIGFWIRWILYYYDRNKEVCIYVCIYIYMTINKIYYLWYEQKEWQRGDCTLMHIILYITFYMFIFLQYDTVDQNIYWQ